MKNSMALLTKTLMVGAILLACTPYMGCSSKIIPVSHDWVEKSSISVQKGDWVESMGWASMAISSDVTRWEPYVNRAWAFCELGYYDKAIEDCNEALALNPESSAAYNNRGLAYHRKGEVEKAKEDYEKACSMGLEIACKNYTEITGERPPMLKGSK
ncbi:MAG: tetratricopeptide repeat protein [Desulfobacteraceae bacterium]|jgi:tetratricopeptide (TPR) repeat protein